MAAIRRDGIALKSCSACCHCTPSDAPNRQVNHTKPQKPWCNRESKRVPFLPHLQHLGHPVLLCTDHGQTRSPLCTRFCPTPAKGRKERPAPCWSLKKAENGALLVGKTLQSLSQRCLFLQKQKQGWAFWLAFFSVFWWVSQKKERPKVPASVAGAPLEHTLMAALQVPASAWRVLAPSTVSAPYLSRKLIRGEGKRIVLLNRPPLP